ncbi:MAG: hypothetical protein Q8P48_08935, partial [Deltaproteobacteria bacterium]|nr:hypothetical protein [Deltaproteobacteria bacterium]
MPYQRGFIKYFVLAALLLLLAPAAAPAAQGDAKALNGLELDVLAGLRVDQFDWNIAGNLNGTSPNVLSELTWSDLEILELKVRARKTISRLYLRGSLGYGFIFDGANQDSDYDGDDRTLEFSRSNNNAGDGSVWDISLGAGYAGWALPAGQGRLRVIPMLGYSLHKQNLTITDGFQTVCTPPRCAGPTGPFGGLDSSYNALWMGPWAGVDIDYGAGKLKVFGSFELHAASYSATADWNLRSDFKHPKSFEHTADGYGIVLALGADYELAPEFSVKAGVERQDWRASDGTD